MSKDPLRRLSQRPGSHLLVLLLRGLVASLLVLSLGCGDEEGSEPEPTQDVWDAGTDVSRDISSPDEGTVEEDPGPPPVDPGNEQDDGGEQPDVPEDTTPPVEPDIDFFFLARDGQVGMGQAFVRLDKDDEPEEYRSTPGFQIDVEVRTTHIESIRPVRLMIGEDRVAEGNVLVEEDGISGRVTLTVVTLPHNTGGYQVKVVTANKAGVEVFEAKNVSVDTGDCGVAMVPSNEKCLTEDADADAEGFQVIFTVLNPEGDCDRARLDITPEGGQAAEAESELEFGQTEIVATLAEAAEADETTVIVTASVLDDDADDRTGLSNALEYTVDNVPPLIEITSPAPEVNVLTLAEDLDDEADGIQVDIIGAASGLPSDHLNRIQLRVGDAEPVETFVEPNGGFKFDELTLALSGTFAFSFTTSDGCGNEGSTIRTFDVFASRANLVVLSPADQGTLHAINDRDSGTTLQMETVFSVFAENLIPGYRLRIDCRERGEDTVFVDVGGLEIVELAEDDRYAVPVVLDTFTQGKEQSCRAVYTSPIQGVSAEVRITVAIPGPTLVLEQPRDGFVTQKSQLSVRARGEGLDGRPLLIQVRSPSGQLQLEVQSSSLFEDGEIGATIPLIAEGGLSTLPNGSYVLHVDASDVYGNMASDNPTSATEASFIYDDKAPTLELVAPVDTSRQPTVNAAHADANETLPGYQLQVEISVGGEPSPEDTRVCLSVGGAKDVCGSPEAGASTVVFEDVTLQSGPNNIEWHGEDIAGNTSLRRKATLTLETDAPLVVIESPVDGAVGTQDSTDVVVLVTDVEDGSPIAGARVKLFRNGVSLFSGNTNAEGRFTFSGVALDAGNNSLQVSAKGDGLEGFSFPVTVSYKDRLPTVAFVSPVDNSTINADTAACAVRKGDCRLGVNLQATAAEEGSSARLEVLCGESAEATVYETTLQADELVFADVVLADQSECQLTATVTDLAGQTSDPSTIKVDVDRQPPLLVELREPANFTLIFRDDNDYSEPGMQIRLSVEVSGIEVGQTVEVLLNAEDGSTQTLNLVVEEVSPGGTALVQSELITLPDGTVTLQITTSDAAGNVAEPLTRVIRVVTGEPRVNILGPGVVVPAPCSKDADCPTQGTLCEEASCVRAWGLLSSRALVAEVQGIPIAPNNLRICSNHPGATGAACETQGYRLVAVTTIAGGSKLVGLNDAPDGLQTFIAEVLSGQSGQWVSSTDSTVEENRSRRVVIDTTRPKVTLLSSPSDLDSDGWLNAAEQVGEGGLFDIRVESNEVGPFASLYLNREEVASGDLTEKVFGESIPMPEGANSVHAVVTDRVGNNSVPVADPEAVLFMARVDTVPPMLEFRAPAKSPLLATDSLDVVLRASDATSGVIGRSVALKADGALVSELPLTGLGMVTFEHDSLPVLKEGENRLSAAVNDLAGNLTEVTTQPEVVFVDTSPPTVNVVEPAEGAELDDVTADHDEQAAGVQLRVHVETTDGSTWEIEFDDGCDAAFQGCSAGGVSAFGAVVLPGEAGEGIDAVVALPFADSPYRILRVRVFDSNGNVTEVEVRFSLELTRCSAGIRGIPSGGGVGNALCDPPGEDCDSVVLSLTARIGGPCGDIDTMQLLRGGEEVGAPEPVVEGQAEIEVTLDHGQTYDLAVSARLGADEVARSESSKVTVDLHSPMVSLVAQDVLGFNTPEAGVMRIFGLLEDQDEVTPDLQIPLAVQIDDESEAVTVESITAGGLAVAVRTPELPAEVGTLPQTVVLTDATLEHGDAQVVEVLVRDAVGNTATSSFTADVDIMAPAPPTVDPLTAELVDRRLPLAILRWSATADDGDEGDLLAGYDVRYGRAPIEDDDDFEAACLAAALPAADEVPAPAASGTDTTMTLSGPDQRGPAEVGDCHFITGAEGTTWYFAVRAIDDAGNLSPIEAGSVSVVSTGDIAYRSVRVTGPGGDDPAMFHSFAFPLGDLDGDGKGDFALGGLQTNLVCVVYGRGLAPDAVEVAIPADGDEHSVCLPGEVGGNFGTNTVNVGDLNADGRDDIAFGLGHVSYDTEGTLPARAVRVHFGQEGGRFSAEPDLVFQGMRIQGYGVSAISGADFDGDGITDLVVGASLDDSVYIVPGRVAAEWPDPAADPESGAKSYYDFGNEEDRNSLGVVTIAMLELVKNAAFGRTVKGVGNILPDEGDKQYDEIVIQQNKGPTQLTVVKGRPPGTARIEISAEGGVTADDDSTVRLRQEEIWESKLLGYELDAGDLSGDGIPDIVAGNSRGAPTNSIYIFDGASMAGFLGGIMRVQVGDATPVADNLLIGDNGVILGGPQFSPRISPPLDDPAADSPTMDLLMRYYDRSNPLQVGEIFIRLNVADDERGFALGQFPWQTLALQHPGNPGDPEFGKWGVQGIGDFDGDGFADILAAVNSVEGALIFH